MQLYWCFVDAIGPSLNRTSSTCQRIDWGSTLHSRSPRFLVLPLEMSTGCLFLALRITVPPGYKENEWVYTQKITLGMFRIQYSYIDLINIDLEWNLVDFPYVACIVYPRTLYYNKIKRVKSQFKKFTYRNNRRHWKLLSRMNRMFKVGQLVIIMARSQIGSAFWLDISCFPECLLNWIKGDQLGESFSSEPNI